MVSLFLIYSPIGLSKEKEMVCGVRFLLPRDWFLILWSLGLIMRVFLLLTCIKEILSAKVILIWTDWMLYCWISPVQALRCHGQFSLWFYLMLSVRNSSDYFWMGNSHTSLGSSHFLHDSNDSETEAKLTHKECPPNHREASKLVKNTKENLSLFHCWSLPSGIG